MDRKILSIVNGLVIALAITISSLLSPVPISHSEEPLSVEEVYAIICQPQYEWNCNQMVRIAYKESTYIPTATNYDCYPNHYNPRTGKPYICAGLLQLMEIHVENWQDLWNPWYNVEQAYRLWLESGVKPWG